MFHFLLRLVAHGSGLSESRLHLLHVLDSLVAATALCPSRASAVVIGVMDIVRAKPPLPASSINATMNTPVPLLNAMEGFFRFPLWLLIDIVRLDNDYYLRV
jgi:hypothetical protein